MQNAFLSVYTVINYKVLLTSQNKTISRLFLTVSRSTEATTNKSVQLWGMPTVGSGSKWAPGAKILPAPLHSPPPSHSNPLLGAPNGTGQYTGHRLHHLNMAVLFWAFQARHVSTWGTSDNQGKDTRNWLKKNLDLQFLLFLNILPKLQI